jgi:predicted N-acetyltransferase YhbS
MRLDAGERLPVRCPDMIRSGRKPLPELEFRSHYAQSRHGLDELTRLIDDVFDVDVSPLDRLGHDPSVVSFGWWDGDRLVANVSLYERCLWLCGEKTRALGVQSVATRPEWRGRGLFCDLMTRALAYADARTGLIILGTGTPALYTRFGFRQIEETVFSGNVAADKGTLSSRRLSLETDADADLLRALFARRTPTSTFASACDHPALFMLRAARSRQIDLIHIPDLDAVVAVKMPEGAVPTLLDIVAPAIPSLAQIASAIGHQGGEIRVLLTPDRLSWLPERQEPLDNGYMVRGPFGPEGRPFMLSDMRV